MLTWNRKHLVRNTLFYVAYFGLLLLGGLYESHVMEATYGKDARLYIFTIAGCLISAIVLTATTELLSRPSPRRLFQPGERILIAGSVVIAGSWLLHIVAAIASTSTDIASHQRLSSWTTLAEGALAGAIFAFAATRERDALVWKVVLGYQAALSFVVGTSGILWAAFQQIAVSGIGAGIGLLLLTAAAIHERQHERHRDSLHCVGTLYLGIIYISALISTVFSIL